MFNKLTRAARGSANHAAQLATGAVDPDQDDQNEDQQDTEASTDEADEDAADETLQEGDEDETDETPDGDEKTESASAVNAETKRVLGIVGSNAGLANPALAIELAGVDEDGHRMSAKRATSLLQSAGASSKKTKTLAGKVTGHSGGLAPDSEAAAGIDGASFNAQMKRKNAAAISLR